MTTTSELTTTTKIVPKKTPILISRTAFSDEDLEEDDTDSKAQMLTSRDGASVIDKTLLKPHLLLGAFLLLR